jgi:hypothetical protein
MSLTILRRMYFANFHSHLTIGTPPLFLVVKKTTKESDQLISNLERVTSSMELFKTLNILPLPCTHTTEFVYYIKFNVGKLEQNFVRHDYNSRQLPDLQTQFFSIQYLKKENNMGIKLLLD